jgi:preprotein translocase subunit Sec63
MYSTQSVVNTRISYIEEEIRSLQQNDKKMTDDLQALSTKQNTLLMDISNRLRDMEVKLTELQIRVLYALEKEGVKKLPENTK